MGIRSFLRGNGDHGSLARGDATRLMPSAGGAGRFPGPPPRAAVGGANFPGPPPPGSGSSGHKASGGYNEDLRPDAQESISRIKPSGPPPRLPAPPTIQAPLWSEAKPGTYGKHDTAKSRAPLMRGQLDSSGLTAAPPKQAYIPPKKRPGGGEGGAPPRGSR